MKAVLANQARRIDALSLRERVFMFVSIIVALGGLADALVLSPAIAEQKKMSATLRTQSAELQAMRTQLTTGSVAGQADTPIGRLQSAISEAREQVRALDRTVQDRLSSPDDIARLPQLIDRVLRRHDSLTLIRMATASEGPSGTEGGAALNANASNRPDRPALRWQGVDLSVAGSYHALTQYLADLERAMPDLRWGALHISTQQLPPMMTVRVFLVGEAR